MNVRQQSSQKNIISLKTKWLEKVNKYFINNICKRYLNLYCIFQVTKAAWNPHDWFKYSVLISEDRGYFYPVGSTFDYSDFSWRKFARECIPFLGNWSRTTQNEVPTLLTETGFCLKELHKTCDSINDDIQTLLLYSKFNKDLDEIVKYLKDYSIIKYLREEDCYDPNIYRTCGLLKKNYINYQKKVCEFHKKLLEIKNKFPCLKKIFLTLIKKIIYLIKKIFFFRLAP